MLSLFITGFLLGGASSATVLWLLAGLLDWIPRGVAVIALLIIGTAILLNELGLRTLKLPANHRQVPQEIFDKGPSWSALQFAFELGTGVRTYLPSAVPYLLLSAILLLRPSFAVALLSGASFGLGRAAMPLSRTASPHSGLWDSLLRGRLRLIQPLAGVIGIVLCAVLALRL